MKKSALLLGAAVIALAGFGAAPSLAQEKTIKIAGFGAKTGPVRSFGVNSEAAMRAAAEEINAKGGIKLGDGSMAKVVVTFDDDRCQAEDGINIVRRLASSDSLIAVGPTCSNVAEPLFGILQKKVDDNSDSGLRFPIFTDVAVKAGLAKISEWAFRNTPNEPLLYDALFKYLQEKRPELKTIMGGKEGDFAHSKAGWDLVMKVAAPKHGMQVVGEVEWKLTDTTFTTQVREMKAKNADVVAIAAHPFTLCGVVKEMARQGVKPKLIIGLTSSSSMETMEGCARQVEGTIIPTTFAPVNDESKRVAELIAKHKGSADLHSTAAWENMIILKDVIERAQIGGKPETLAEDRRKVRDVLASLKETQGLLGVTKRTEDREAVKPFVFVTAKGGNWVVTYDPTKPN
jgi:branched-chain amino acid transport system substrate-binding protein